MRLVSARVAACLSWIGCAAVATTAEAHPDAFAPGGGAETAGAEMSVDFAPLVLELDFAHRFPGAFGGRGATLLNGIATPVGITFDTSRTDISHEWKDTLGLAVPLFKSNWNVVGSAFLEVTSQSSGVGTALGIAFDLHAVPGYFAERWFLAADLGVRLEPWTYLQNSSAVYANFQDRYPVGTTGITGPQNGFYVFPIAPRFDLGFAAERRFGPIAICAAAGYGTQSVIPAYGRLGLRWEFL